MIIQRIYFQNTQQKTFKYKDKLHRVPTLVMRIVLFLSFILYGYHQAETTVNALPYFSFSISLPYPVALIIGQLVSAGVALLVFEIVAKFYYSFIGATCFDILPRDAFLTYLRAGYIVRNILGGILKFIFFRSYVLLFCFDGAIGVVVTTLVLTLTCIYVIAKYIPTNRKSVFIKSVAIPYIVYQIISVGVVFL